MAERWVYVRVVKISVTGYATYCTFTSNWLYITRTHAHTHRPTEVDRFLLSIQDENI
jgi:hypothetical protein